MKISENCREKLEKNSRHHWVLFILGLEISDPLHPVLRGQFEAFVEFDHDHLVIVILG